MNTNDIKGEVVNYPDIIPYDDTDKYDALKDSWCCHALGFSEACKYAKENNGVVYTIVDGWGNTVDWFKGSVGCDRLGYVVVRVKVKNEMKGGDK